MKKYTLVLALSFVLATMVWADYNKAKELYDLGSYDEAIAELNNILTSEPGNLGALELQMRIYRDTKKSTAYLQSAKSYALRGGNVNYDTAWALSNLAHQIKDYQNAVFFSQICNKLNPNNHSVLNLMGVGLFYLKKYELSIVALKTATRYLPSEPTYNANLARSYEYLSQYKKAYYYYQQTLKYEPSSTRAVVALNKLKTLMNNESER